MKSVTKIEETNNIKNKKSKIESKNVQIMSSEINNKEKTRNKNAKSKSNTSTQNKSSKKTSTQNTKDKTSISDMVLTHRDIFAVGKSDVIVGQY